jgi:hypothetical protein
MARCLWMKAEKVRKGGKQGRKQPGEKTGRETAGREEQESLGSETKEEEQE